MNYRRNIQKTLDETGVDYAIKTNQELMDAISENGCGMAEFHTADMERLILEHGQMHEILKDASFCLATKKDSVNKGIFDRIDTAVRFYQR